MHLCGFSSTVEGSNSNPNPHPTQKRTILTHSVTDPLHWPAVYARFWSAWLTLASPGIVKNTRYYTEASVASENIIAWQPAWWVLNDISGMPLHRGSRQLASSLTWKRPMKQPAIWHHSRPSQDWPQRQTACFVSEYLRDRRIRVKIVTIHSDEFYPKEGVPTGGVLAVTCFGLKINELPSCIARDVFRALFVDDLAICFRGRSLDTTERHLQQAVNAIQEWATRNGFKFAAQKCKVIQFTAPDLGFIDPFNQDWKHISASGWVNEVPWAVVGQTPFLLKSTSAC